MQVDARNLTQVDATLASRGAALHGAPFGLLVDWYDEWIEVHRAYVLEAQVYAAELAIGALISEGHFADAVITAAQTVEASPLRERSNRLLIQAQIAAGDPAQALTAFRCYETRLERELGITPSLVLRNWLSDQVSRTA